MKFFGKELKFNNNKIYHSGDKPTPSEIGAAPTSHNHQASQVTFTDGKTFQQKLDDGSLRGPQGATGSQGPKGDTGATGPQGAAGAKGADGLTTSVTVGSTKYTHSNGNITIPAYPTALKNPSALTLQFNGTTNKTYDGSSAQTLNITPAAIGAAASSHTHNYAASNHTHTGLEGINLDGVTASLNNYNLSSGSPKVVCYFCPTDGGGANITGRPNDSSKQAFNLIVESLRYASSTDYINKQT